MQSKRNVYNIIFFFTSNVIVPSSLLNYLAQVVHSLSNVKHIIIFYPKHKLGALLPLSYG